MLNVILFIFFLVIYTECSTAPELHISYDSIENSLINVTKLSSFDEGVWFEINIELDIYGGILEIEDLIINSTGTFQSIDTSVPLRYDGIKVFSEEDSNQINFLEHNLLNFESNTQTASKKYFLVWVNNNYENLCVGINTIFSTITYPHKYSPSKRVCSEYSASGIISPSPPPPEIPPPYYPPSQPPGTPPSPPVHDSTMVKDPHLKFANGATADFRGLNNTVFNILSYPNISFSMKTMDVSFLLPKPMKVDGSFFTEAFFLLNESSQKFLLHVDASMPGFEYYSLNTMPTKKIKRYKSFEYDNVYFGVKPDYYELSTLDWVITVLRKPIYNSLTDNMNWRLDTRIRSKSKYGIRNVHGIVGQTFQKDRKYAEGKKDNYSGKTYVKTSAQAEGVIDGTYTDYIINNVYKPDYKYSMFENSSKNEYSENDKKTAYSDEIVFKDFE